MEGALPGRRGSGQPSTYDPQAGLFYLQVLTSHGDHIHHIESASSQNLLQTYCTGGRAAASSTGYAQTHGRFISDSTSSGFVHARPAQAIRKVAELGWTPVHILNLPGSSVGAALKPAGLDNAKGILSAGFAKDPTDPSWKDDAGVQQWTAFMDKYYPEGDKTDGGTVTGYSVSQTIVQVLKQPSAGNNIEAAREKRQVGATCTKTVKHVAIRCQRIKVHIYTKRAGT